MPKKHVTVSYTANEIKRRIAKGENDTDWKKADQIVGAQLEASIRSDPDDLDAEPDWTRAVARVPPPKDHINIRIDHDVLEWFKSSGRGYQTLMNNVLRAFVQTRQRRVKIESK